MRRSVYTSFEYLGFESRLLSTDRLDSTKPSGQFPDMPASYYFNATVHADRRIHPRANSVAESVSPEEIVKIRRDNYSFLAPVLQATRKIELLYPSLPIGVCPLAFPIITPDRDKYVFLLKKKNIEVSRWWAGFCQKGIDWAQFPEASWLKRNIITLPIHQDIDEQRLNYLAASISEIFSS